MNEEDVLNQVSIAFEYCYLHDAWVTPLDEALSGIDSNTARLKLSQESKSIWEIVLHLTVWNENIVERVQTKVATRPIEGAWPKLPEHQDAQAWETAKHRLRQSFESVQTLIHSTTMTEINASPYGLADLLCRFTHAAYHIGQITILKQGLWGIKSRF